MALKVGLEASFGNKAQMSMGSYRPIQIIIFPLEFSAGVTPVIIP
jgi:hypothetical protein